MSNTRFRLLLISLAALLVAAAWSFPAWYPLLLPAEEDVIPFPELSEAENTSFSLLPPERQADYIALRAADPALALEMVSAALAPPVVIPADEQVQPQREGQVAVLSGEFEAITPNRSAEGGVTLYELPDGSRYLWLDGFSTVNGPGLRLFLSTLTPLQIEAQRTAEEPTEPALDRIDILLDPLRATVGGQAYDVPAEADLGDYESLVIFSTDLALVWAIAPLN